MADGDVVFARAQINAPATGGVEDTVLTGLFPFPQYDNLTATFVPITGKKGSIRGTLIITARDTGGLATSTGDIVYKVITPLQFQRDTAKVPTLRFSGFDPANFQLIDTILLPGTGSGELIKSHVMYVFRDLQ